MRVLLTLIGFLWAVFPAELLSEPPAQSDERVEFRGILPRGTINTSIMGVNAFANDLRFGSVRSQYEEVKSTLRLKHVRVLFHWNDLIQSSPSARPNFSFYDDIARSIPRGVEALVVLTGLPTWMRDSRNWIDGNPRKTFIELWAKNVMKRYKKNRKLKNWQMWNEPNFASKIDNQTLDVVDKPENYYELLRFGRQAQRRISPRKRTVNAATTAINQNFPETLDYNEALLNLGAEALVDAWAVHYYGSSFERVILPGGVRDVLDNVNKPIWVTESGEEGVSNQLEYVEETWPFLTSAIPGIARFYYYQFTESTDPEESYGLRTLSSTNPVSDLYVYLRDR